MKGGPLPNRMYSTFIPAIGEYEAAGASGVDITDIVRCATQDQLVDVCQEVTTGSLVHNGTDVAHAEAVAAARPPVQVEAWKTILAGGGSINVLQQGHRHIGQSDNLWNLTPTREG